MVGDLLILGFTLSLDNFRTSIALGGLRLPWRHAAQVAVAFGIWDCAAPFLGLLLGHYLSRKVGSTADYVGAGALGLYGLYLLVEAWRTPAPEELDRRAALFGLPLPLSLDNIVAGTSLGFLGFSPWVAPPIFGAITVVMSFAGLQVGRAAAQLIRIRSDLLTGVALVVMAGVMAIGAGK